MLTALGPLVAVLTIIAAWVFAEAITAWLAKQEKDSRHW